MTKEIWTEVDRYFEDRLLGDDPILASTLQANAHAALPAIDVSPNQGMMLYLLAKIQTASRILEIGTLGGYSTIWLARALPPDGHLITLELEEKHAEVARTNIERAGFAHCVEFIVGKAVDSLEVLKNSERGPFDLIFIDADKESLAEYYAWAVKLSKKGTIIIVDNVVREGAVIDPECSDERVRGVQRFVASLSAQTGVQATAVQTVGAKGYDGFIMVYVNEDYDQ